ncbi:MAG: hypothetical protein ACI9QL_002602 [Candidatus Omnitrophota bacterium]|jgi:hypothetical protein
MYSMKKRGMVMNDACRKPNMEDGNPESIVRYGAVMKHLRSRAGFAAFIALTGLVVFRATLNRPGGGSAAAVEAQVTNRPLEIANDPYIGSQACKECHKNEYVSWHRSYHRTMTRKATPENVIGNFDQVSLTYGNQNYHLSRKADTFQVSYQDRESGSEVTRPVVMTTGKHHMQFYWMAADRGRETTKFPFVWLLPEERWVPADATFLKPPDVHTSLEVGQWNYNCIACHTTGGQPGLSFNDDQSLRRDTVEDMETRAAEFGIACEACHEPGRKHVQAQADKGSAAEMHITQPIDLPEHLSSQVCGQCHSIQVPRTAGDHRTLLQTGNPYRPGGNLMDADHSATLVMQQSHFSSYTNTQPLNAEFMSTRFWSDGTVRVSGREFNGLIESPCYTHGDPDRGILSCMSCHTMHPREDRTDLDAWADDQLKPGMRTNKACLQCHESYGGEALTHHTHHVAGSSGSLCTNCHMPYTSYGLLKAIRSHTIESPSVQNAQVTGKPTACNQCHLDRTLAWTAERLAAWYALEPPPLSPADQRWAASVRWTLEGDAGQRALMAWSFGWQQARDISGESWMPPYLFILLDDPYDAVRIIAHRSLKTYPGYSYTSYNPLSTPADRRGAIRKAMNIWKANFDGPVKPEVLLIGKGQLDRTTADALMAHRNNRRVALNE